jgi:hypothetical protein
MRRLIAAQHDCRAGHALVPDQSDLDLRLVCLDGDDRGESGVHEIDCIDPPVRPFDLVPDRHGKGTQVRLQQCQVRWR